MADVRCPMCGKSNPAERETCQFCQARLKPLRVSPSGSTPAQPTPMGGQSNRDDDLPDWLRDMRPVGDELPPEQEEDLPNWLKGSDATDPGVEQSDLPDWLKSFRSPAAVEERPVEDYPAKELPAASDDAFALPDWLSGLDKQATPSEQDADWRAEPAADIPDWLVSSGPAQPPAASAPQPDNDLPDWFSPAAAQDEDLPDWSQPAAAAPAQPPASEEGLPDWLAELTGAPGGPAVDDTPEAWAPPAPSSPELEQGGDFPDWLQELNQPAAPGAAEAGLAGAEDLPDWIRDEETRRETPPERTAGPAAPEPASAIEAGAPDWMAAFLRGGFGEQEEQELAERRQPGPAPAETPAEEDLFGGDLDWLQEMGASAPELPESLEAPPAGPRLTSGVAPFAINDSDADEIGPLAGEQLPDWLAEARPADAAPPAGGPVDSGLTPAELPSWLEAMRPVPAGSGKPSDDEPSGEPETAGPLAGLRGTLPVEPHILQVSKPIAHPLKLQVAADQQARAELLAELVQREGEAKPLPARRTLASQHILRIGIAILLILTILVPLFLEEPQSPMPLAGLQTSAANELIQALPGGANVLVAVDFEPGLSGELTATAAAVLDHLMIKGAYLAFVSTTPVGSLQAERLVRITNEQGEPPHQYRSPDQYLNLGFIPGGPAGLLAFVESPRQAAPLTLDNKYAWMSGALENVQSLADFALVMVITENPETARNWIEQVGPGLERPGQGKTPLLMVVSAQAEPLVRPYYEGVSNQVQGVVSGLSGGASYEDLMGRSGLARTFWTPFSLSLIAAALLILLGGLFNAGLALWARRKGDTEGEG